MTEHERKEFEHHKKIAEDQLNKMYYGVNKNQKNSGRLEMPPFLASPKQQSQKIPPAQNSNQADIPKPQSNINKSQKKNFNSGKNLLSLLNFKDMKIDNDRLIILAVCLLLSGEDVDEMLLLALLYIML